MPIIAMKLSTPVLIGLLTLFESNDTPFTATQFGDTNVGVSAFNPDPEAGELVLEDLRIRLLPRFLDLNQTGELQ